MSVQETKFKAQFVVVQFLVDAVNGQDTVEALKQKLNTIVSTAGKGECAGSPIMGFKVIGNADVDAEAASALANESYKETYVFDGEKDSAHFLMVLEGDVSPTLHGPFDTDAQRVIAAQSYRVDNGDEDGLYRLNVPKGAAVQVGEFAGAEVQGGVYDEFTNSVISAMLQNECPIQRIRVHGAKYFTMFVAGDEIVVGDDVLAAISECFDSPLVEFTNGVCDFLMPESVVQGAMLNQWKEFTAAGHINVTFDTWSKENRKGLYKSVGL